jgi:hypothetical protein
MSLHRSLFFICLRARPWAEESNVAATMTPYSPVEVKQRFGGTYSLHHQVLRVSQTSNRQVASSEMQMMNLRGTKHSLTVIMDAVRSSEMAVCFTRIHVITSYEVAPHTLTGSQEPVAGALPGSLFPIHSLTKLSHNQSHMATDGQSVRPSGAHYQILVPV